MKRLIGLGLASFVAACVLFTTHLVQGSDKAPVTYAKDVAAILNKNCVSCHRPGEVAPAPRRSRIQPLDVADGAQVAAVSRSR